MTLRLFNCRKAVDRPVNGPAVGIGATVLLPMDVRIASSEARFGFVFSSAASFPKRPSEPGSCRASSAITQALEWCYSGRVFGAEEALGRKLVSRVVAPSDLIATARAQARSFIATTPRRCVALIRPDDVAHARRLAPDGGPSPRQQGHVPSAAAVRDVKEGIMSFLEKRPAQFSDTVSPGLARTAVGRGARLPLGNSVPGSIAR